MKKILLLMFVMTFLFSCVEKRKARENSIKVAFWGSYEEVKAIKQIAAKIEKEIPEVKLKLEHIAVGGDRSKYSQKILTEAAGGSAPDIAFCEVNLFVDFYFKGLFVDLTPFVEKDKEFSIDNYFPSIVKRFTVNDHIYIIPRDVAPFAVVYYNKDLFDKAGVKYPTDNWNVFDLLKYAKKLTKTGPTGTIAQYGFYTWAWHNFLYSFGGAFVDNVENPKKCMLDTPDAIAGLQFYIDLMYKHKVMPTPAALSSGYQELFKTGKLAMYCSGIWETPELLKGITFNWDVVMFPKGPEGKRGFATGGSGYGILKWTKNKELAWEVLKRLASSDAQKHLAQIGLAQPADKNLADSKVWAGAKTLPRNKKMLNTAVNYIVFEPFTPEWNFINSSILSTYLDPVFLNQKKLIPALRKTTKEITDKLQEENL